MCISEDIYLHIYIKLKLYKSETKYSQKIHHTPFKLFLKMYLKKYLKYTLYLYFISTFIFELLILVLKYIFGEYLYLYLSTFICTFAHLCWVLTYRHGDDNFSLAINLRKVHMWICFFTVFAPPKLKLKWRPWVESIWTDSEIWLSL
jgi:hypothetical protein